MIKRFCIIFVYTLAVASMSCIATGIDKKEVWALVGICFLFMVIGMSIE